MSITYRACINVVNSNFDSALAHREILSLELEFEFDGPAPPGRPALQQESSTATVTEQHLSSTRLSSLSTTSINGSSTTQRLT